MKDLLRWIGAIVLPLPGAWLASIIIRFSWYIMGFESSVIAHIFEYFGTGAVVPLIAYYVAPRKGAATALVISLILIAFTVFCMGVCWYNITVMAFLKQCVVFAGTIVGVVISFHLEKEVNKTTE